MGFLDRENQSVEQCEGGSGIAALLCYYVCSYFVGRPSERRVMALETVASEATTLKDFSNLVQPNLFSDLVKSF